MNTIVKVRKPRKLPKFINAPDVAKMLSKFNRNCPTGCRNYAMFVFMYRGGFRVHEVCTFSLPDVNFDTGEVYVQQSKCKKDRYVPLDNDMLMAAKEWLKMRELAGIKSNFFFCTLRGGKLNPRYVREVSYRISEKAGVYIQDGAEQKKVSPHKYRHSYATELVREGVQIRYIQELLGHSSLASTQVYTHVANADLVKTIKARKPMMTPTK